MSIHVFVDDDGSIHLSEIINGEERTAQIKWKSTNLEPAPITWLRSENRPATIPDPGINDWFVTHTEVVVPLSVEQLAWSQVVTMKTQAYLKEWSRVHKIVWDSMELLQEVDKIEDGHKAADELSRRWKVTDEIVGTTEAEVIEKATAEFFEKAV